MNRFTQTFERLVDRLLSGDRERRVKKLSVVVVIALLVCSVALIFLFQLPLTYQKQGLTITQSLWKVLLSQ